MQVAAHVAQNPATCPAPLNAARTVLASPGGSARDAAVRRRGRNAVRWMTPCRWDARSLRGCKKSDF
ncbi:MAG: hypothetical protein R2838_15950 [Caldilineaceae bacterium]